MLQAPIYFPAEELDRRPLIKVQIAPVFPPGAPVTGGRVVLRLYVGEQGEVEKIAIVSADPPGAFENSAVQAFSAARFIPGMKNGVVVRTLMTIEVTFGEPPAPGPPAPPT